jgi:hypothetical protein
MKSIFWFHQPLTLSSEKPGFNVCFQIGQLVPLRCGTAPVETYDMSTVASDLSGVTWNPETETVFVVNNGGAVQVYS